MKRVVRAAGEQRPFSGERIGEQDGRTRLVAPGGGEYEESAIVDVVGEVLEQRERVEIGPVQVLEGQGESSAFRKRAE